ncbi:WD40 repeat domain-containing protein [Actinomadura sp. 6N118]|uniref:WD40 repeat domain-containing protein n=1 Tax=Actinomadura sp. 6N118 TaxID=3375151 RepID=UPI0037B19644
MTSRLHHALSELAEQAPAPRTELTGHVITRARRRRRVRLIAMPAAAAGVAAAIVVGSVLTGGTTNSAPPAVTVTVPRNGVLNDGPLPGPLPAEKAEPIRYAFLDHCKQKGGLSYKPPVGDCGQWRLLDRSGKLWRVADGMGAYPTSTGDYMNSSAPLEISPDGRRIAYFKVKEQRYVVRDLSSGRITPVGRRMSLPELYRAPAAMAFSGDGRWLAVASGGRSLLADTTTGAVSVLPAGSVVGLGQDAATVVLTETKGSRTTLVITGRDGRVRGRVPLDPRASLDMASGENWLSPDGRTLFASRSSHDGAVLVDVRTGKVIRTLRIRMPGGGTLGGITGWAGPSKVFTAHALPGWDEPAGPGPAPRRHPFMRSRGLIIDLDTGKSRVLDTYKLRASQISNVYGGYTS